eukprot:9507072-Heterocapsa_arctica.AAC.1
MSPALRHEGCLRCAHDPQPHVAWSCSRLARIALSELAPPSSASHSNSWRAQTCQPNPLRLTNAQDELARARMSTLTLRAAIRQTQAADSMAR